MRGLPKTASSLPLKGHDGHKSLSKNSPAKKLPQIPKRHSHPSWNVIHRISSRPASWPVLINESSEVKTECCHRHREVVLEMWSHLQQRPEFARSKLCDQAFQLVNVLVHFKTEVHLIAFLKRIILQNMRTEPKTHQKDIYKLLKNNQNISVLFFPIASPKLPTSSFFVSKGETNPSPPHILRFFSILASPTVLGGLELSARLFGP